VKNKIKVEKNIWAVLLIFMVAAVVPLLVQLVTKSSGLAGYDWFSYADEEYDFFLVCKMRGMIVLSAIMFVYLATYYYKNRYDKSFLARIKDNRVIFGSYGVYIIFALISSFMAFDISDAFFGGYAQYEPFFVLLGYGVVLVFTYIFLCNETNMLMFLRMFVWGVLIISLLGVLQFAVKDFFCSDFGKTLITMFSEIDGQRISLAFEEGRVYMTLYNPNYVGSYVALVLPVMIGGAVIVPKVWEKCIMGIAAIMLVVSVAGSDSSTGKAAIVISLSAVVVFGVAKYCRGMYKTNRKRVITIAVCAGVGVIGACAVMGSVLIKKINSYEATRGEHLLTGMELKKDKVVLDYKEVPVNISYLADEKGQVAVDVTDADNKMIEYKYNSELSAFESTDPFYKDLRMSMVKLDDESLGLTVTCGDISHTFCYDDKSYYYYNTYGKRTTDVVKSEALGFKGYESFGTNRGFLWSRSLPLMYDSILTGCGPDNFVYTFPNNDYISMANNTYQKVVVTRPHNMYLQIGVQTGLISLIAILVLYVVYFVQTIKLVWKCNKRTMASVMSVAILCGSVGYMLCGISNDTTICVSPVYWVLLGMGMACNVIIKKECVSDGKNS